MALTRAPPEHPPRVGTGADDGRVDGAPDVFRALAHPVRRAILEFLAAHGDEGRPIDSGEIAERIFLRCHVMWPATSKHLRVLREAGLVETWSRGASRLYRLDRASLTPVRAWTEVVGGPAR